MGVAETCHVPRPLCFSTVVQPVAVALPVVEPTAVALPSKEDLALGIKDKISSVLSPAAPPPPMPVSGAVSGVPQATSGTPVLVPEVTRNCIHPIGTPDSADNSLLL